MHLRFETALSRRNACRESGRVRVGAPCRAVRDRMRQGLSLMELLLVLVIMAVVAAMILPQLFGVEARQALRSAADQLNGTMVDARQQAMVSGQTMFMLFQFETGLYAVVPEPIDQETTARFDQVTNLLTQAAESSRMSGMETSTNLSNITGVEQLPSGARFLTGQAGVAQPNDTSAIQADLSGLPYIAFAPDGTTDDAIIQLISEEQDRITVQLRGLTGAIRIGELTGVDQFGAVQ